MANRIQFRRGTAHEALTANPVLAEGEFAYETDTRQWKVGDGVTAWNDLDYGGLIGQDGPTGPTGPQGEQGEPGVGSGGTGVPAGGAENDLLQKASGTDYDIQWATPSSMAYFDTGWVTGPSTFNNWRYAILHNLGLSLSEVVIDMYVKSSGNHGVAAGTIMKVSHEATWTSGSGGTYYEDSLNQISYQNYRGDNLFIGFDYGTGVENFVSAADITEFKFVVRSLETGAFKGDKGETGDKGDTGETGPQGNVGYNASTWDSGTTYSKDNLVVESGETWVSVQDSNTNNQPSTDDGTWWTSVTRAESYPIGGLAAYLSTSIPTGWLRCDGSTVNIADYPDLYAVIGTTFGGDGVTTFELPDLQGIGVAGVNTQTGPSGQTWGSFASPGDIVEDQFQDHQHIESSNVQFSAARNTEYGSVTGITSSNINTQSGNTTNGYLTSPASDLSDARTGDHTRSPYMAVWWCIKARMTDGSGYDDANLDQRVSDLESGDSYPFSRGHLFGMHVEEGVDYYHDATVNEGECRDYQNNFNMILSAPLTKRIDEPWEAGTNKGGLFSGTVAADTTYHFFVLHGLDGTVDAGWDTDIDCANIPSGYNGYRRIRSYITDSSANLIRTTQIEGSSRFNLRNPVQDYNSTWPTSQTHISLTVPEGMRFLAHMSAYQSFRSAVTHTVFGSTDQILDASTTGYLSTNNYAERDGTGMDIYTNDKSEIAVISQYGVTGAIKTYGWTDQQGRMGGK